MKHLVTAALVVATALAVGCKPEPEPQPTPPTPGVATMPSPIPGPTPRPDPKPGPTPTMKVCTKLDFTGVAWSPHITGDKREAFRVALDMIGTFEGHNGWSNLTNNFDGMGVSAGLFNQTLGTGSLQPLLVKMRDRHLGIMQRIYSPARLNSLLGMVKAWESARGYRAAGMDYFEEVPSKLDEDGVNTEMGAAESTSVRWAVNNLYSGTSFKPEWRAELQAMLKTPEYITIQIEAAETMHFKALAYLERLKVPELRTYFFSFDIIVQNGSFKEIDWVEYERYLKDFPGDSNRDKLIKMLNLRLRHVRAQYYTDVQKRKTSLIDGEGIVHGRTRKYEQEYCFNRLMKFP